MQPHATEPLKPLIRWAGGKRRLVKHLLPLITEHTCYVEPFFGGGALFFARPARSRVEVIADTNGELVNLYRQVKWHPEELQRELSGIPNAREEFFAFLAQPGLTEIQRAARFAFRAHLCFGGKHTTWGIQKKVVGGASNTLEGLRAAIARMGARLDRVQVENRPWQDVVRLYDAPGTFFFFDPPYLNCNATTYAGWTRPHMEELAAALRTLKGQWLLTADAGESREVFAQWPQRVIARAAGNANASTNRKKTYAEIIACPRGFGAAN